MLKTTYRYEQTAARLVVEGFPDLSAGHSSDAIGILSSWRLQLVGAPELEGTRDHLEALMAAVMPYARHRLSGVERRFGQESGFVSIGPDQTAHLLELRSSREGVEPLQLKLDDAELADLVRCLDQLRIDSRVKLTWAYPNDLPLRRQEIIDRIPVQKRLGPALLGGVALACTIAVAWLVPMPQDTRQSSPTPTAESKPQTQSDR